MYQRLVRAKRKISAAGIPYRVPPADELPERLGGVLHVVYLIFTEGHIATAGDELVRADLCEEAIRLARLLVELLPDDAEVARSARPAAATDARRAGAHRRRRRAVSLERPGPRPVGPRRHHRGRWRCSTRALRPRPARPVPGAGGHRRPARRGAVAGRHRLGPDRRALRRAGAARPRRRWSRINRAVAVAMADGPHVGLRAARAPRATTTGSTGTSRSTPHRRAAPPGRRRRRCRGRLPEGHRPHRQHRRTRRVAASRRRARPALTSYLFARAARGVSVFCHTPCGESGSRDDSRIQDVGGVGVLSRSFGDNFFLVSTSFHGCYP